MNHWGKRYCLAMLLLMSASIRYAHAQYNYPGGIVDVLVTKQSNQIPVVRFGTREPIILEQDKYWRVLVGLDLATLPGEYLIYVKHATEDSRGFSQTFIVEQKEYPILNENLQRQINHQYKRLSDLDFSNTEQPSLPLRYPVNGKWSERFGHVLNSNDENVVQQNLISINVPQITTVIAPQNAIVSRIETNEFDISVIHLDHGRGLYSIISGVSDLTVEIGNGVVAGAVLGKSPYYENQASVIRWQTVINGVYVNPVILTQLRSKTAS